jgi:hypothetical protein
LMYMNSSGIEGGPLGAGLQVNLLDRPSIQWFERGVLGIA